MHQEGTLQIHLCIRKIDLKRWCWHDSSIDLRFKFTKWILIWMQKPCRKRKCFNSIFHFENRYAKTKCCLCGTFFSPAKQIANKFPALFQLHWPEWMRMRIQRNKKRMHKIKSECKKWNRTKAINFSFEIYDCAKAAKRECICQFGNVLWAL